RQVADIDGDVERLGDRVVVGDRDRAGGGGGLRRDLLLALERGAQPGGAHAEVGRHGRREGRVVEGVGTAAAVDHPIDAAAVGGEQEAVVVGPTGQVLDGGERADQAGDVAGVGAGDVPGGRGVGAGQGVAAGPAVDREGRGAGGGDAELVVAAVAE